MCRIYGYVTSEDLQLDAKMKDVSIIQRHGGPDDQNYISNNNYGIGANRLAITDPSGGRQPYGSIQGIYACLNGEIYNHLDLRNDLEARGYRFEDKCDGTIIPALYQEHGISFVELLDGMFSIAILDVREASSKLILMTDNMGMKPIYYTCVNSNKSFAFATELPGLLSFSLLTGEVRHDLVNQYMTVRAISDGQTFVKDAYSLKPASILIYEENCAPKIFSYTSAIIYNDVVPKNLLDAGAALRELLRWEISRLIKADALVCSVNSGGLDSSLITVLANKDLSKKLASFHVSCKGNWPFDERAFAQEVAVHSGSEHYEAIIDPDDIPSIISDMVKHLGHPNAAPHALSTFCLFKEVGNKGYRVALTGEGSDELFCGHSRMVSAIISDDKDWKTVYLDGMAPCTSISRSALYKKDYLLEITNNTKQIDAEFTDELIYKCNDRSEAVRYFEQRRTLCHYILHRAEPLAMASAVEVRIPFCQPRVVDFSWKLANHINFENNNRGKAVVYSAANELLPRSVLDRPKQPFTLPITSLMYKNSRLLEYARDVLSSKSFIESSPFNHCALEKIISQQETLPSRGSSFTIWALIVYATWISQLPYYCNRS